MTDETTEYKRVAVASVTVTTVVPYTEGAEYREYNPTPENLPAFLESMDDPAHAERVVDVEIERE